MNKKFIAIVASAVLALAACLMAGCSPIAPVGEDEVKTEGNVGLIVSFTTKSGVTNIADNTSVKDYMDALAKNNELVYGGSNGDYGYFVDSFFGLKAYSIRSTPTTSEGYGWSFYIDFISLDGDAAVYGNDYQTYDLNGVTLYSANYGVSGIPCVEGHAYAFVYEYYNYSW